MGAVICAGSSSIVRAACIVCSCTSRVCVPSCLSRHMRRGQATHHIPTAGRRQPAMTTRAGATPSETCAAARRICAGACCRPGLLSCGARRHRPDCEGYGAGWRQQCNQCPRTTAEAGWGGLGSGGSGGCAKRSTCWAVWRQPGGTHSCRSTRSSSAGAFCPSWGRRSLSPWQRRRCRFVLRQMPRQALLVHLKCPRHYSCSCCDVLNRRCPSGTLP